jgi:hypothetical protein
MTPNQKAALQELSSKSIKDIQIETAEKWAYRTWAAKRIALLALNRSDQATHLAFTLDANSYCDEALEHAALSGDDTVLAYVRQIMDAE